MRAKARVRGDELDILLVLVEAYEARHHPVSPGDPIEILQYKLDELGWSQRELARRVGWGSGRVSEILNRRRSLTVAMIGQLGEVLSIPAGLLVGEEEPDPNALWVQIPAPLARRARAQAEREDAPVEQWVVEALGCALPNPRSRTS